MNLIEARNLADKLKVHIGKFMKPYDDRVISIEVVPNDLDQISTYVNILCFAMGNSEQVLRTYPKQDYTVAIFFDELNLWKDVRWESYERFKIANEL